MSRLHRGRVLALLPGLGGSLGDLARHGQVERLLDYYFPAYLEYFDTLRYFSYEAERLEVFTGDVALRRNVEVIAPTRAVQRHVRAISLAFGAHGGLLRGAVVARAFQALGALPCALSAVPYACTLGYAYPEETSPPAAGPIGAVALPPKRAAIRVALRFVLRRAQATIVTTAAGADQARTLGARAVELIANGVDVDVFKPGGMGPEYDVTYVGRLAPVKGVDTLVAALAEIRRPLRLCVVGSGPEKDRLSAMCRERNVDAVFLGVLPNRDVAGVLARSRCFVLPSWREGHPKALLEALAAGLPCIASDIPAIRELAMDGLVVTFRPGDAPGLARCVHRVLSDERLRETIGQRARSAAENRFDLRRLVRADAELLARLADVRR